MDEIDRISEADARAFMNAYGFVSVHYDGVELTSFNAAGEPFGASEFLPGSPTREAIVALEVLLSDRYHHDEFHCEAADEPSA